jgi:hypothetical protein
LSLEYFSLAVLFYWLVVVAGSIEKQQGMLKQTSKNRRIMESHSFAPGVARRETKQQKKERLRKAKLEKQKEKLRKAKQHQPFQSFLPRASWLILPFHITKGLEFWILTMKGDTFVQKRKTLLQQIENAKKPIVPVFGFDSSLGEAHNAQFLEKAKEVMTLLVLNQKLRWMFKCFLTKARMKRFSALNQTDPITMEPIVECVWFPSFLQRKIYNFEAKPFSKYLHNLLVHNDGHIPDSLYPKNPLTNEGFSLPQLISLIHQTQKYGYSSWAIEAFAASRYDMTSFMTIHSKPLRLHALRMTMAKIDTWDSIDTLYDFIKSQHAAHNVPFCMSVYKWAVYHAAREARIESWRTLCLKWYEVNILIDDDDMRSAYMNTIKQKTLGLCSKPEELSALRIKRKKPEETVDGSRSL